MAQQQAERTFHWTTKRRAFPRNVVLLKSPTKAAIASGFSEKSASSIGSILMTAPEIQAAIARLEEQLDAAAVTTALERRKILAKIERADLTDFLDDEGVIKPLSKDSPNHEAVREYSVEERYTKSGHRIVTRKLKLADAVAAIQEDNKMTRTYEPAPVGNTTNNTFNILVPNENAKALLQRLLAGERTEKEMPVGDSNTTGGSQPSNT